VVPCPFTEETARPGREAYKANAVVPISIAGVTDPENAVTTTILVSPGTNGRQPTERATPACATCPGKGVPTFYAAAG
jgi:hypothetical protein